MVGELSSLALTEQEVTRRGADFVVSTVPLPPLPVPVIVASAFLTASDRAQIDAVLAVCAPHSEAEVQEKPPFAEAMAEIHRLSGAIHALLTGVRLREDVQVQSIEALAETGAHLLIGVEAAEEFAAALLRREQIAPTWVAPQMILLHAQTEATDVPRFGVLRLAQPLPYGDRDVCTALVMCAAVEGGAVEKHILGQIAAQIGERPAFADILAHGDAEEIRRALEYVFEEHFREVLERLL